MPVYPFRCEESGDPVEWSVPAVVAPAIGALVTCRCTPAGMPSPDLRYPTSSHAAKRLVSMPHMAEVKGTGNGKIGRGLDDRAELGRKRRAEWE